MQEIIQAERDKKRNGEVMLDGVEVIEMADSEFEDFEETQVLAGAGAGFEQLLQVRRELFEIRDLLTATH